MSEETTSLTLIDSPQQLVPVQVFTTEGTDYVLERMKERARTLALDPKYDISTPQGRKNRASLAYEVSKSKVELEKMGDKLVEGWRTQTKAVTVEKTRIEKELAELRDEIRKPLTDWEDAEKLRAQTLEDALNLMQSLSRFEEVNGKPSSAWAQEMIEALPRHYEKRDWQEFKSRADLVFKQTGETLAVLLQKILKEESDAAELARLRAEEEQRVTAWHALHNEARDENIAFDAARKAKKDAEDKAEKDRIAAAAASAAREKALQDERDAEARRAKESEDKAEKDRLQAIKDKKDAEDAAAQRERNKIAKEKADEEKAAAAREADKKHKAKINNEALDALINACFAANVTLTKEQAKEVIVSIANGKIPHVSIKY